MDGLPMNKGKEYLMALFGGCTAFLWRYAWITYLTQASHNRSFPFFQAAAFFCLAYFITVFTWGKGRRIITVLLSHITGFGLLTLGILHRFYMPEFPLFQTSWIVLFFHQDKSQVEWLLAVFLMLMPVLFWVGGTALAKNGKKYQCHCGRLDTGVAFFSLLFLTKLYLRSREGIVIPDPLSIKLFYPFLLFGISGIALSKNKGDAEKEFLAHHRGTGIVLTFTAGLLFLITGVVLLSLPFLHATAETGFGILKIVGAPVGSMLIRILRFLFTGSRAGPAVQSAESSSENTGMTVVESAGDETLFQTILLFFMKGFGLLIGLALSVLIIWLIVRWLLSRTKDDKEKTPSLTLATLISLLKSFLSHCIGLCRKIYGMFGKKQKGIPQLYASFLRWGRRGGLPRNTDETPDEYRIRLLASYPFLQNEIDLITETFNRSYYGMQEQTGSQTNKATTALRKIRKPVYFFQRLRVWISQ